MPMTVLRDDPLAAGVALFSRAPAGDGRAETGSAGSS
jgi:hypothetical protein